MLLYIFLFSRLKPVSFSKYDFIKLGNSNGLTGAAAGGLIKSNL